MRAKDCIKGQCVDVRGKNTGFFKIEKLLEKGACGKKVRLVEVRCCHDRDFIFSTVETVRLSDLTPAHNVKIKAGA